MSSRELGSDSFDADSADPMVTELALAFMRTTNLELSDLIPMPGSSRIDTKLFAGADLVCAGTVNSQRDASKEPERSSPGKLTVFLVRRAASVTLSRSYKGSPSKAVVTYDTHEPSYGDRVRELAVGTQHLLLLTLVAPKTYSLSYDFADFMASVVEP